MSQRERGNGSKAPGGAKLNSLTADDPNAEIVKQMAEKQTKKKTKGKRANPQSIDVFKALLFTNASLNPREYFKFRQQDQKEEEKRLAASTSSKAKKSSLKERIAAEAKSDNDALHHQSIAIGGSDDDYNDNEDEMDAHTMSEKPDFTHQTNGFDHMFALVQRNPVIMYPPRNRFVARAMLNRNGPLGDDGNQILIHRPQTERFLRISGQKRTTRDETDENENIKESPRDDTDLQNIPLSPTSTNPKSAASILMDRKAEHEASVRDILSLLDQRLAATRPSDSARSATPQANNALNIQNGHENLNSSHVSNNNDNDNSEHVQLPTRDRLLQQHIDALSLRMLSDTTTTSVSNLASAALYHHRQLDAYLGSLYEFNHQVFTSLTLNDLLFQLGKLGRDAAAHVTNFTESIIAERTGVLEREEQAANLKRLLEAAKGLGEDDYRQSQILLEEEKHKQLLASLYPEQHASTSSNTPKAHGSDDHTNTSIKNEFDYDTMMAMANSNHDQYADEEEMMNSGFGHDTVDEDPADFMMHMMLGRTGGNTSGSSSGVPVMPTRRTLTFIDNVEDMVEVSHGQPPANNTSDSALAVDTTQLAPFSDASQVVQ